MDFFIAQILFYFTLSTSIISKEQFIEQTKNKYSGEENAVTALKSLEFVCYDDEIFNFFLSWDGYVNDFMKSSAIYKEIVDIKGNIIESPLFPNPVDYLIRLYFISQGRIEFYSIRRNKLTGLYFTYQLIEMPNTNNSIFIINEITDACFDLSLMDECLQNNNYTPTKFLIKDNDKFLIVNKEELDSSKHLLMLIICTKVK